MTGAWQVRDYRTARAALAHPALDRTAGAALANPLLPHVLNQRGAAHRQQRAALAAAVDELLPSVAVRAQGCARTLIDRCHGEIDVAGSLVRPFALLVVDELVGVSGGDPDELRWWHDAALATDAGASRATSLAIEARMRALLDARRLQPRDDLLSRLVSAGIGEREAVASGYFAFTAGYVNLTNFLGRAMAALADHRTEYAWLREHRGAVPAAVDELLRYAEPPARASLRHATRDIDLAGHSIAAGTAVHVFRAAANRDPARFADAHTLDLRRPDARASLAFGAGPHYCVGAELVRAVADLFLLQLVAHVAELRPTARTDREWDFAAPLWLELREMQPVPAVRNEPFARSELLKVNRVDCGGTS